MDNQIEVFSGKRVLISGASSGIGLEAARYFFQAGARVILCARNQERLKDAVTSISAEPQSPGKTEAALLEPFVVPGDVSSAEGCRRIVERAVELTAEESLEGGIDILVPSAGIWLEGPVDEVNEEEWDSLIDINLKGTFFLIRYAVPWLEKSGGSVVTVASDSGITGNADAAAYCASKGGVVQITRSLAVELAPRGIRVNAVCPGDVETPMMEKAAARYGKGDPESYRLQTLQIYPDRPRKRFARPEEVAKAIAFLADPGMEAMTGACLSVDFGLTAGY